MSRSIQNKDSIKCSFCGKNSSEVACIVSGPNVYICDECVLTAKEIIRHDLKNKRKIKHKEIPIPDEIKKHLDDYVIGQERAKKVLSVAVYNHYKRIESLQSFDDEVELEKSNILLIGPTGVGKTLLAQTLAHFLDVPFAIADATTLTEAGYVGEDVENILVRLLQIADYDLERTERGIIYIDEIDKIGRKSANPSITRDVSGEGVQQALLKILEGTLSSVPPQGGRKHPEQRMININTKNILFICGGTFEGIEQNIQRRIGTGGMGFGAEILPKKPLNIGEILIHVEPDDLLQFGMIPELIGRLPVICALDELSEDALMEILLKPKNAIIKQYKKLFELEGVRLKFAPDVLREVVRIALKRKTGARGLRSVLENTMLDVMFNLPSRKGVKECLITKEVVLEGSEPVYAEEKSKNQKEAV